MPQIPQGALLLTGSASATTLIATVSVPYPTYKPTHYEVHADDGGSLAFFALAVTLIRRNRSRQKAEHSSKTLADSSLLQALDS